jgi:hypothetical protein
MRRITRTEADLHEHDPEKRKTYERLTQAINEARDRGDIDLLERIAKDPQAFILNQGRASVFGKVARPSRRPHDKAGRKLDAKERREVEAWAFLSRSFDVRSRR